VLQSEARLTMRQLCTGGAAALWCEHVCVRRRSVHQLFPQPPHLMSLRRLMLP